MSAISTVSNAHVGGLVGTSNSMDSPTNCYNTGAVQATGNVSINAGGIAGTFGFLDSCYNTGTVQVTSSSTSTPNSGGIAGANTLYEATIDKCYYLSTVANQGVSGRLNSYVFALTSTQMKQQSSFVGFDFANTWAINPAINNGYPYLRGMQP